MKHNKRCSKCGQFLGNDIKRCPRCVVDALSSFPLALFRYPDAEGVLGDSIRYVRVVRLDDKYIQGFEDGHFKKFCVNRLRSAVTLVEFVQ